MSVKTLEKNDHFLRKVNQTGNSLSIGLPKDIALRMNLQKGDDLQLTLNEETDEITIKKVVNMDMHPNLLKSMDRVMIKYSDMFENLKNR
ncbi:AbrB/MazE/SpoVT family DNA-binding domain-containing protein [Paenisporosarcina antarctica]|uniref:AbrB/MazE/SpoVT family DNA-binding domain-containing protein n=1 Tax=Paenisporosarcina antarctica TaxID=417367 RepID=A0A4P6ZYZ3_9BACL|nr:AbrB/MazE/SpoVT family DNA-binding domain-containing protein [Paenisporosarcina antarctica]QBP41950.1 AbrB/MazE/SpoVT family DNA-binding domain-containing protein [Paenisporosarcina antarctica]